MYHFVVKQIVRESFRRLSQGNYQAAINLMAEQCHYRFIGRHRHLEDIAVAAPSSQSGSKRLISSRLMIRRHLAHC